MHQKQPPPKSAISVLLVGLDSDGFIVSIGLVGGTACTWREQEKFTALVASRIKMAFLIFYFQGLWLGGRATIAKRRPKARRVSQFSDTQLLAGDAVIHSAMGSEVPQSRHCVALYCVPHT